MILSADLSSSIWIGSRNSDEVMTEDGIRLVVEKLDKNRVESVHIYLPESDVTASDTHTETAAVSSDDSSEQKVSSEHEV